MATPKRETVDDYIARKPPGTQKLLKQLRAAIRKAAPKAEETISYRIPAYKLNGMLVWFAAHTHHIGLYPGASAIRKFKRELTPYKSAKGSVRFPLDEPLPLALIARIVRFRVREHTAEKS